MSNFLRIKMFNKFELISDKASITYEDIRSDKMIKLLVYLLMHRKHAISSQEIMEVLWQNEDIDSPVGALKNLVYRVRNFMKKELGIEDCIITGRGSYAWNNDIIVESDVEIFENALKKINNFDIEDDELVKLYQSALSVYDGAFMPTIANEHWVIPIATYYHSSYISMVKDYADILDDHNDFEEMEIISKKAIGIDPLDEELHNIFLRALIGQGKQQVAIDHYKATVKMLYETLGTRPSDEMQGIYEKLQKIKNDQEMDLITIQKDLEEHVADTPFFCEYGTFKDIYRLQARLAGRLGISIYISLITLLPNTMVDQTSEAYLKATNKAMNNMQEILNSSLRVGDVIARYSNCQYVVLLPTCTFEDATNVMQRLLNKFYIGTKNSRTKVQYNLQELVLTDIRYK